MEIRRTTEGSETWNSDCEVTSAEIKYLVIDPTSKKDAMQACFDDAPGHIDSSDDSSLEKSGVRFDSISGDGCYEISVLYEEESASGDYSYRGARDTDYISSCNFDCGGGTRHITHSEEQETIDGDIDPGGVIGWNGKYGSESQIAGVDIPAAQMRESYTRILPASKLTIAFKRKVAGMVGKVNSTVFKGWEAGEVMFLGCTYNIEFKKNKKERSDDKTDLVSVTYNFAIHANEDSFTLNYKTYTRKKKGFEYVWAISETVVNENNPPSLEVKGIFIDKICEEADFNELGLGK